jgi:drug/metabolite transporter (DMT)-like permease
VNQLLPHSRPTAPRAYYWLGAVMVLVAAFCFACKGILIKLAYQYGVDAISLVALRMLFSLPFYVLLAWRLSRQRTNVVLTRRQWAYLSALGIIGYYFASYFNFLGLLYITASLERVLLFVYPTFVLLLGAFYFGRRIRPLQLGALALTYLGIGLAFLPNLRAGEQKDLFWGAFWVVLSGLVYALYLVGSDRIIPAVGSRKFTCYAMIAATVPTLLHALLQHGAALFGHPAPVYYLSLVMALFVTVLPTFLLAEGIGRVGSGNTSIIASIGPIFTIVLASVVLDEQVGLLQLTGTLLVLAGVVLVGWKGEK